MKLILKMIEKPLLIRLIIFIILFQMMFLFGSSGNDKTINWNYNNNELWDTDGSNPFGSNASITSGKVESPQHRFMWGRIPANGSLIFCWKKDFISDSEEISLDYINFSFYINNIYNKSCNSDDWSNKYKYYVYAGQEIKFDIYCESPPSKEVQGWVYLDYVPNSAEALSNDGSFGDGPENAHNDEASIAKDANYSSIIAALTKPCGRIIVEDGADLQEINDVLERLQNNMSIQHKIFYLQNGEYNGSLKIRAKNFELRAKRDAVTITSNESNDYNIILDNTSEVTLDGLKLKNSQYGLEIFNCTNCNILNNSIESFDITGLLVVCSAGGTIDNNIIKSPQPETTGIHICDSYKLTIKNNFEINVDDFEYYFENQSCLNEYCKNKIYIEGPIYTDYGIFDNEEEYFVNGHAIYSSAGSYIGLKKETEDNIWEVQRLDHFV